MRLSLCKYKNKMSLIDLVTCFNSSFLLKNSKYFVTDKILNVVSSPLNLYFWSTKFVFVQTLIEVCHQHLIYFNIFSCNVLRVDTRQVNNFCYLNE